MNTLRTRVAIVTGTSLALLLTSASLVGAQTPDQTAFGGPAGPQMHGRGFGGPGFGPGGRGFGGGFRDRMEERGLRIAEQVQGLVRQELTTLDEDGMVLTQRVEHGTVAASAEGSITITLPTDESVTVATDADTDAWGWSLDARPYRDQLDLADIAVGDEIVVWSESQDDGTFLAERITVLPSEDMATDDTQTPEASPSAVG